MERALAAAHHDPAAVPATRTKTRPGRPDAATNVTGTIAAVPARLRFDPWNNVSRGHQRADNRLAQSVGWRQSRAAKLQGQLREGLGGGGGPRQYDLVGEGAVDGGLEWVVRREEERGGGGMSEGLTGREMEWVRTRGWRAGEEAICREVRGRTRGEREEGGEDGGEDEGQESGRRKRLKRSIDGVEQWGDQAAASPLAATGGADASYSSTVAMGVDVDWSALHASVQSADDDDEVWDDSPGFDERDGCTLEGRRALGLDNPHRSACLDTRLERPSNGAEQQGATYPQPPAPRGKPPVKDIRAHRTKSSRSAPKDAPQSQRRHSTPPPGQTEYATSAAAPIRRKPPTTSYTCPPPTRAVVPTTITAAANALLRQAPKPIFTGLTVHIAGPTFPLIGDHALRQLLVSHGATLSLHVARRQVTHIILGPQTAGSHGDSSGGGVNQVEAEENHGTAPVGLSASKFDAERRRLRSAIGGPGIRFVAVEWALESIRAGKRLGEARFAMGMTDSSVGDDSSRGKNSSKRDDARISMPSGPLTHAERGEIGIDVVNTPDMIVRTERGRQYIESAGRVIGSRVKKRSRQDTRSAPMPGAPPGVPSVRSLFLKQHRDNAWRKAGFVKNMD